MRILVVDDQKSKYRQIRPIIDSIFPDSRIRHCKTFISAISNLERASWDLVFLDMSFDVNESPTEEAGFEGLAGLQILQHLYRANLQTKVIIFTAHNSFEDPFHERIEGLDALNQHVQEYFQDLCLGCIYSKTNEKEIEDNIRNLWFARMSESSLK